jgi:CheY-like chemotaxis protein
MPVILIIEDAKAIREEILDILRMENYEVLEASNGNEALSTIESHKPDLILSDIRMPVMDGFELLKALHKLKNKIPIIIMSAKAEKAENDKALALGAVDYLIKPCSPEDLILCFSKYLLI